MNLTKNSISTSGAGKFAVMKPYHPAKLRTSLSRTVLIALSFMSFCSCQNGDKPNSSGNQKAGSQYRQGSQSQEYFKTHWQDESQFIVETIVTDVAEMAFYAKHGKLPDPRHFYAAATQKPSLFRSPIYEIEIAIGKVSPLVTHDLTVNGPIWAPEVYSDLAKKIFDAVGLSSGDLVIPGRQDEDLLVSLCDLNAQMVERQNQAISDSLSTHFRDATLHEKAAVVLGAFMLRENSGSFLEIRSPLCRMTAHLALARQLGGQSGANMNGQFAEAMLFTLMNNQKTALERLAGLEGVAPALQPWVRALRARNTGDYRILSGDKQLTFLEKIEFFVRFIKKVRKWL